MKYLFLLIFLPLFSLAQTKEDLLQGTWVKAKAEIRDGSRIVDHDGCGMSFVKYTFMRDGNANLSYDALFDNYRTRFKLSGDSLIIGGTLYDVIKLTNDTLAVSIFAAGADDNQLPLYYFVKIPQHNTVTQVTYDAGLKDSVYQANNILFPQCKGSVNDFMSAANSRFDKGTMQVSFVIDKKGHLKNYTVLAIDSVPKSFASIAKFALSSLNWQPAQKNGLPVNSIVQITFKTDRKKVGTTNYAMNSMMINYDFIPKAPYPLFTQEQYEEERQRFKNAATLVNTGNVDKAIELLTQCIEIDNIDLSAYNLRAMIYARYGKMKEACKDWTALANLGQVSAAKSLAKYCK